MTTVVNLFQKCYDVYIGRTGKGKDGYFGNPVIHGKECPICAKTHKKPVDTIDCYEEYLKMMLETDEDFKEKFYELKGKVLGCFCKPRRCHGDIMVKYLEVDDNEIKND